MANGGSFEFSIQPEPKPGRWASKAIYETARSAMYCGPSEQVLASKRFRDLRGKAQLVFTSPPFPLVTEKSYGNHRGEQYIEWLSSFAVPLKKLLKPNGSVLRKGMLENPNPE